MILHAHATRAGEPVACAYGCFPDGDTIGAGFLFVRAGVTEARQEFTDPATGNTYRLTLPPQLLNLSDDAYIIEVRMETYHEHS